MINHDERWTINFLGLPYFYLVCKALLCESLWVWPWMTLACCRMMSTSGRGSMCYTKSAQEKGVGASSSEELDPEYTWIHGVRPQKQGSPKTKVSNMFYIWCTIFFPSFPMPRAWGMMSPYLLTSHVGHLISSFRCSRSFWVVGSSTGWTCVHWCAATIYIIYIYTYIARVWQLWYIYINNNNSNNNNNNDNMCIYLIYIYIYTYIYLTNPFAPIRIPHIFGLWLRRVLDSELGVHLSLKGLPVYMFLHSIQQPGIWSSQVACIILAYVILSPSRSIVYIYIYILYGYIIWYHFTSKKYRSYQFIFNNAHTYTHTYIYIYILYTIIYIYIYIETDGISHPLAESDHPESITPLYI